jgi:superfamily II DNA/RNA helicase
VLIALCSVSSESYSELEGLFAQMDEIGEDGEATQVSLDDIEDVNVKSLLTELFEKHWKHMVQKVGDHGALTFAKRRRTDDSDAIETSLVKEFRSLVPENIKFIDNEPIGKIDIDPETGSSSDVATAGKEQQKRVSGPTLPPNYVSQEQLRQRMEEYNAKYRSKSLMELNKEKLEQEKSRKHKRREGKEERHKERKHRKQKEKKKRKREADSSDEYYSDGEDREKKKKRKSHRRKDKKKEDKKKDHKKKEEKHKHSNNYRTESEPESEGEMRRNLQKKGYLSFDREQDMRVSSLDKKHLGNIFQNASKMNERFSSSGFHSSFM